MVCIDCGCEKLITVKVYRNRIRKDNQWVSSDKVDTRLVICDSCGARYYVESTLNQKINWKNDRKQIQNINKPSLFDND